MTPRTSGAVASAPGGLMSIAWVPQSDLSSREWIAAGRRFGVISRCSQWWIGDWLRYGVRKWGEKYSQAARITGYDVASLRNMAWVASQFDLSLRSDKLSWSHHVLLVPLEVEERREWMERAIRERLSVADLRTELRAVQRGRRPAEESSLPVETGTAGPTAAAEGEGAVLVCPKCGSEVGWPAERP
ncbi:MAG: LmbU family transcriptional regulator [Solirubrobacterales bacterium]